MTSLRPDRVAEANQTERQGEENESQTDEDDVHGAPRTSQRFSSAALP
ncbi:MAG: hypothetical protein J0I07_05795 [Myxococcales bacterium]|nr:hypothetical protein [Myxococcales bacterium]